MKDKYLPFILAYSQLEILHKKAFFKFEEGYDYKNISDEFDFANLSMPNQFIPKTWHIRDIKNALEYRLVDSYAFTDEDYQHILHDLSDSIRKASIEVGEQIIDQYVLNHFINKDDHNDSNKS